MVTAWVADNAVENNTGIALMKGWNTSATHAYYNVM